MKPDFDDNESLLIWLYVVIDSMFAQTELPLYTERTSNNRLPFFTDVELFTCAIFAELMGCKNKKHGYRYIRRHYATWFPKLPTYEVYSRKLNQYHEAFAYIYAVLAKTYGNADQPFAMIDTAPIEVCQAQHSSTSRAAQPFVSKGYCRAKKKYYIGAKLQIIAQGRTNKLAFPWKYHLDTASVHDLTMAKETLPYSDLENTDVYGDKAYIAKEFQLELFENYGINLITPNKKQKGQSDLTLFQRAANSIHSSIRQTIDTLFGWINDQTGIENASKVRSVDGLFYHVNVKMVAALILMIIRF